MLQVIFSPFRSRVVDFVHLQAPHESGALIYDALPLVDGEW